MAKSARKTIKGPRQKAPPTPKRVSPRGFTAKQLAFIEQYPIDKNGTQAAIRAGFSARTAESAASRLLRNVKIREAIDAKLLESAKEAQIDAAWLLKRLADEANADVNDLYDSEGHFKPVSEWPKIWRQGLVVSIDMGDVEIGSGKQKKTERRPVRVKLSDRAKRLELVGRHVGVQAWRDRVDHGLTGEAEKTIVDATMSVAEAAQLYKEKLG